jgi:hypothetical protein
MSLMYTKPLRSEYAGGTEIMELEPDEDWGREGLSGDEDEVIDVSIRGERSGAAASALLVK